MLVKDTSWAVCSYLTLSGRRKDIHAKCHKWSFFNHWVFQCLAFTKLLPLTITEIAPKWLSVYLMSSLDIFFFFSTRLPILVNVVFNERTLVGFLRDGFFLMFLKGLPASLHAVFKGWISAFFNPRFLILRNERDIQHTGSAWVYHPLYANDFRVNERRNRMKE